VGTVEILRGTRWVALSADVVRGRVPDELELPHAMVAVLITMLDSRANMGLA
jgi:hypothetical protein